MCHGGNRGHCIIYVIKGHIDTQFSKEGLKMYIYEYSIDV